MSAPVHRTSARQSGSVLTSGRQNQNQGRSRRPGSPSGNATERALFAIQSRAGNRAATATVQRARSAPNETAPVNETPPANRQAPANGRRPASANPPAPSRGYRDRITAVLDRLKKNFEFVDTFVKGFQVPVNAGFTQNAAATVNDSVKHSAAASGAAAGSETAVAESVGAVLGGLEAAKARKDVKKYKSGAAFHGARKKFNSKGTEAAISATSAGSQALGVAKELTKAEQALHAASAAEVSGIGTGVAGVVKGARATRRLGLTARKYHHLKDIEKPDVTGERALARLNHARMRADAAVDDAYAALDAQWDHDGEDRLQRVSDAIDAAWEATDRAHAAVTDIQRGEADQDTMNTVLTYALGKQRHKMGKQALTAVGETTKAAGGIVTAVAATAGGAGLAITPVGWGLAAGAAGLIFGVAAYKAGRAGKKRYDGARHPERWAAEDAAPTEPATREDALKEALKFWKKVENGERQAMARKIYALAAGPDIGGQGGSTPEMRDSARALLVALKAGPANQKLTPEAWAESLNDPTKSAAWVKEITEQLSSA
ncbi:hypothetical protein [Streptomyces sp. DW26H14]|uniref:hypothetical protein n=1 Tax=Streptomyces sp. DW26H14 TaxID=3435395 RepID=UPI00403DD755